MNSRDLLHTETLRLVAVQKGELIDTPLEARFNRIVRVARRALDARVATVSLLDDDREWMKATDGWDLRELPRNRSLVAALVGEGQPVLVGDTLQDNRCRNHPLVTHRPAIRFCALYPLRDRAEGVIGALAAYDTAPRGSGDELAATLIDIGQLVQRELFLAEASGAQEQLLAKLGSARRQALLDDLTRVWNRRGGMQLLERAITDSMRDKKALGVCVADLDRFKVVNDRYGHPTGDLVLKKVAAALVDTLRPTDIVCRLGGEEFLLIIPDVDSRRFFSILERVRRHVESQVVRAQSMQLRTTISLGGYVQPPDAPSSPEDLVRQADAALLQAKAAGRNVVVAN